MRISTSLCGSLLILMVLACLTRDLAADEPAREIIDKTNWEIAEGLVQECLQVWGKEGEMTLPAGELNCDTVEYFPLNEGDTIVETETGRQHHFPI